MDNVFLLNFQIKTVWKSVYDERPPPASLKDIVSIELELETGNQ